MKTNSKKLIVLGALALLPGFTAKAPAAEPPRHREITVWVKGQTGTLLGSGYASSYLTNIRARTIGKEDPKLRRAINSLDGLGMLPVRGFGLVPAAVAWQTEVPMRTLIQQQADTGLSYGELLIANSFVSKSKAGFADIVARRVKTRTWGELADQLQINLDFVVTRARTAAQRIVAVDSRNRRGLDHEKNNSFTSINPHNMHSQHH